jgi:hypothetical protein
MTYPDLAKPNSVDAYRIVDQGRRRKGRARANPRNLNGFLDAFKAEVAPGGRFGGIIPASLTPREQFA